MKTIVKLNSRNYVISELFMKRLLFILLLSFSFSQLLHPEENSLLNQTYIRFEWQQIPNAGYYVLYISDGDDIFNDCIVCNINIDSKSLIYIEKNNLEWDKTYKWGIISYTNDNEEISTLISTFSIGSPISNVTTNLYTEDNQDGLTIFGSFFDYYSAVIDENGNEIWNSGDKNLIFYNTDKYGRFFGAEFIGNDVENNYPGIKFDFENGILWQEPGDNFIHHDIFQLPNGNYIGLGTSYGEGPIPIGSWTPLFQGLGFEADGQTIEFDWMGDKIIEWDADTKEEVWTWNVFDHFSMLDYDQLGGIWFEAYNTNRFDWTHANALWFDEDDSAIYLSSRHLNRISKIDYPSGEVIWNLGHELGSGDIDCGQDIGFSFQHSVQKLSNGNILTFDNGNLSEIFLEQENKTSRSIEIEINESDSGCTAELAWEYILPEELFSYLAGSVQKLQNGNYLSTSIGSGGTSIEVNENGDEIWQANYGLQLPSGLIYRAMKIPGIFPIAYSLTFPQFQNSLSEMIIENEDLEVVIKNNGDYTQKFNYNLDVSNNLNGYEITFSVIPEHHPELTKINSFNIVVPSESDFYLISKQDSFILNPNEEILLLFNQSNLNQGDINNDGEVNIYDIIILINLVFDNDYIHSGDINEDGELNIYDCILLVNLILDN